jgi:hypothetical protein
MVTGSRTAATLFWALSVCTIVAAGHAAAQTTYPENSIRKVVVFPPGSPAQSGAHLHEAQPSSSFADAYRKWKAGHNMSTFQPKQDADVLAAVAAGDCAYANGAIFLYGRVNLPGAEEYSDPQVIAYGETVDKLVDACERDHLAKITRIN